MTIWATVFTFFPYGRELRGRDESSTFMMTKKNFCDGIYEKTNVKVLFFVSLWQQQLWVKTPFSFSMLVIGIQLENLRIAPFWYFTSMDRRSTLDADCNISQNKFSHFPQREFPNVLFWWKKKETALLGELWNRFRYTARFLDWRLQIGMGLKYVSTSWYGYVSMYAVVVQMYVALSHSLINFDNTAENYVSLKVISL